MLDNNLFGTFHRYAGSLVTGDSIMIGSDGGILEKAQSFTSEDGMRLNTL